jgi:hypothetical protein
MFELQYNRNGKVKSLIFSLEVIEELCEKRLNTSYFLYLIYDSKPLEII